MSAFIEPANEDISHLKYKWTLLSGPKIQDLVVIGENQMSIKLKNVSEGLYRFRISVFGQNSYGEALANVTVLPG